MNWYDMAINAAKNALHGAPVTSFEGAILMQKAEMFLFEFEVPSDQAWDWLDAVEHIRHDRELARIQIKELLKMHRASHKKNGGVWDGY